VSIIPKAETHQFITNNGACDSTQLLDLTINPLVNFYLTANIDNAVLYLNELMNFNVHNAFFLGSHYPLEKRILTPKPITGLYLVTIPSGDIYHLTLDAQNRQYVEYGESYSPG
jgi:hypothetical protein